MLKRLLVIVIFAIIGGLVVWKCLRTQPTPLMPADDLVDAASGTDTADTPHIVHPPGPSAPYTPPDPQAEKVSNDVDVRVSPALDDAPLTSIYEQLDAQAALGDEAAACRLIKAVEACNRYQKGYVGFTEKTGRMGPYEAVSTQAEIDALDLRILGMPMEVAARICSGFNPREHELLSEQALITLRTRRTTNAAYTAALQLQQRYPDPENVRVVEEQAQAGNIAAVAFLAAEYELPGRSFYGAGISTSDRFAASVKWLTVMQYLSKRPFDKNRRYGKAIDEVSQKLEPPARARALADGEAFARRYFIENSHESDQDPGFYSLDAHYCGL